MPPHDTHDQSAAPRHHANETKATRPTGAPAPLTCHAWPISPGPAEQTLQQRKDRKQRAQRQLQKQVNEFGHGTFLSAILSDQKISKARCLTCWKLIGCRTNETCSLTEKRALGRKAQPPIAQKGGLPHFEWKISRGPRRDRASLPGIPKTWPKQ